MAVRLLCGLFCPLAVLTCVTSARCSGLTAVTWEEWRGDERFRVIGVANSGQCYRLCVYTSGCSRVAFRPQTGSCTLGLDPPSESGQLPTGGAAVCKRTCERRPCPHGHTCAQGLGPSHVEHTCHTVLLCGEPPVLQGAKLSSRHNDRVLGSVVEYTCIGYSQFVGTNSTASCTYTSRWLGPEGHCAPCYPVPGFDTKITFPTLALNVTEAESTCSRLYGGHLLTVNNDEKWAAVVSVLKHQQDFNTKYVFVDGVDKYVNSTYYFAGGGTLDVTEAWARGEPNGLEFEHCLVIGNHLRGFMLFDARCDSTFNFICEMPI